MFAYDEAIKFPMSTIQADHLHVTDSKGVQAIKQMLGERAQQYISFFVKVEDGAYVSIYGIHSLVQQRSIACYRLIPQKPEHAD